MGRNTWIVLGGGQAIPGIEELIMEAKPGQTIERPVKWPSDFPDETQRRQDETGARELAGRVKRKGVFAAARRRCVRARGPTRRPHRSDAFIKKKTVRDGSRGRTATRDADASMRQKLLD